MSQTLLKSTSKQTRDSSHFAENYINAEIEFEIYNTKGEVVIKGAASVVDISELNKGVYYLHYPNNRSEPFIKK
ncbi:MAG: T9SS type A sorting domain-containing protein [Colwellia sp.]|nr:T9SS type A sorting domain-containing protein [Colwellia sp.]